jgi:hypothetical protein
VSMTDRANEQAGCEMLSRRSCERRRLVLVAAIFRLGLPAEGSRYFVPDHFHTVSLDSTSAISDWGHQIQVGAYDDFRRHRGPHENKETRQRVSPPGRRHPWSPTDGSGLPERRKWRKSRRDEVGRHLPIPHA